LLILFGRASRSGVRLCLQYYLAGLFSRQWTPRTPAISRSNGLAERRTNQGRPFRRSHVWDAGRRNSVARRSFHRQAGGNQRDGALRPVDNDDAQRHSGHDAVSQGLVAALACGSLKAISSGVFFTNTTSLPRNKKLFYTDAPAPYAANARDTGWDLAASEITAPCDPRTRNARTRVHARVTGGVRQQRML
jgi:hypothetical protein